MENVSSEQYENTAAVKDLNLQMNLRCKTSQFQQLVKQVIDIDGEVSGIKKMGLPQ